MSDITQFNRLQTKCLESSFAISKVHEICKAMLTAPTQENMDKLVFAMKSHQEIGAELYAAIQDFVKEVAGEDDGLNAIETEIGYKV